MAAAMAGGKGKKKKWSKGKSRDQVDNKVLLSKEQYDRMHEEVPKMKLITVSAVVEKLRFRVDWPDDRYEFWPKRARSVPSC